MNGVATVPYYQDDKIKAGFNKHYFRWNYICVYILSSSVLFGFVVENIRFDWLKQLTIRYLYILSSLFYCNERLINMETIKPC